MFHSQVTRHFLFIVVPAYQSMNPVIKRRLPPSVRRLLTDIGPKDEWQDDTEPDGVSRDGILLPARAAAAAAADGQEGFLTPAKSQEEMAKDVRDITRQSSQCMLCHCKAANYTCPRCNLHYCGLVCYQSPDHAMCSEEFYKESVLRELKNMGKAEAMGMKKMHEILIGLKKKAEQTDGGMESVLRDAGVVQEEEEEGGGGEEGERVEVAELLSRLAELQQSGGGNTTEIESILMRLEEIGRDREGNDESLAEDDDCADLGDRLSGLDIDNMSEEELWELLDCKEKEKFMGLLRGGALGGLVPLWKPWWEEHEEGRTALVELLKEEDKVKTGGSTPVADQDTDNHVTVSQTTKVSDSKKVKKDSVLCVPSISTKIPKLSSICAHPSPLVGFSLVNSLYCYTFSLCLFNGDTDSLLFEFCDMILALSEALSSNRVFGSIQEALDGGESLILGGGYFDKHDPSAPARAVEAVAHILTGRDAKDVTGYCLAALSQLRSALSQARAATSKEGGEGTKRRQYFQASKKCEFFQAWVLENAHQTGTLAIQLWNEHSRRESARKGVAKSKVMVEESFKKGKRKENSKLIQELS